jgi:23S rRNA (pseudouridine1915-N3)-methyltransferase
VPHVKIYLYYIGKARDTHANAMAAEYIKRSGRFATCEMREIQPKRFDPWDKHPSARKILLDPAGRGETHQAVRAGSGFRHWGRRWLAD